MTPPRPDSLDAVLREAHRRGQVVLMHGVRAPAEASGARRGQASSRTVYGLTEGGKRALESAPLSVA
jgi:hypothetical protein